jgi:hypothetical protein
VVAGFAVEPSTAVSKYTAVKICIKGIENDLPEGTVTVLEEFFPAEFKFISELIDHTVERGVGGEFRLIPTRCTILC